MTATSPEPCPKPAVRAGLQALGLRQVRDRSDGDGDLSPGCAITTVPRGRGTSPTPNTMTSRQPPDGGKKVTMVVVPSRSTARKAPASRSMSTSLGCGTMWRSTTG